VSDLAVRLEGLTLIQYSYNLLCYNLIPIIYFMGRGNFITYSCYLYYRYLAPTLHEWGIWSFIHRVGDLLQDCFWAAVASFKMKSTITAALIMSLKFILLLALLIFIRGGVPRYRYDFLTKIGWIKFLNIVLGGFLILQLLLFLS